MSPARPQLAARVLTCSVYSAVLVGLAGAPSLPALPGAITDVHLHAVAYGLHALILYWTTAAVFSPLGAIGAAWIGASAFGGLTELHQLFRPPRTPELKDLLADIAGAGAALLGLFLVRTVLVSLRSATAPRGGPGGTFARRPDGTDHHAGTALSRGEHPMNAQTETSPEAGPAESSRCIHCRAPIAPGASRCARCLSWQSRWAGDSQNPRLELLLLGVGAALVAVLAVWLYAFGSPKPKETPRGFVAGPISVLNASVVPRGPGGAPAVAVTGTLRNGSTSTWRDMYLYVRAFDAKGNEIDTFPARTIGLVLPPGTDTNFRVIEGGLLREPADYARCTVEVRWATRVD